MTVTLLLWSSTLSPAFYLENFYLLGVYFTLYGAYCCGVQTGVVTCGGGPQSWARWNEMRRPGIFKTTL